MLSSQSLCSKDLVASVCLATLSSVQPDRAPQARIQKAESLTCHDPIAMIPMRGPMIPRVPAIP